jgi:hypothetical protein
LLVLKDEVCGLRYCFQHCYEWTPWLFRVVRV